MEELTITGERSEFDREIIKKRGVVRAKYWSWEDYRNGLITFAAPTRLVVLFQTAANVATSYFTIKIEEVKAGLWDLIYTNDFEHIYKIESGEPEEDLDLPTAVRNIFKETDEHGGDED